MKVSSYHFMGIGKSYANKTVIHDARIKVGNAQCTLLIGENGSGKSTLLRIVAGLEKPDTGLVRIDQKNYSWRRYKSRLLKNIMYLHQQPYLFDGTVKDNFYYLKKFSQCTTESIDEAIEWAGLQDVYLQRAKSLSGGEKQRVAIARAYLRKPDIVLLDEPTANLDQQSKVRMLELLHQFKKHGTAMIIASHDPDLFHEIQDERLLLKAGKLTNLKSRNKAASGKKGRVIDFKNYQSKRAWVS